VKPGRENRIAWRVLLAALLVNGWALGPELAISRVDLNDNVFHFTLIERIAQALERARIRWTAGRRNGPWHIRCCGPINLPRICWW